MTSQHHSERSTAEEPADRPDVGTDPMHPHPQDRAEGDGEAQAEGGEPDDDSPAERYRDSPGLAASRPLTEEGDVPEPNEPG
jgi:hypothetical protein